MRAEYYWYWQLHLHEATCSCYLLSTEMAVYYKLSADQVVNKNCVIMRRKQNITNQTHHAIITFLYRWNTPNRKWLQTNEASIWILTNIFLVAILFQLSPRTICVNTEISLAVMASVFESVISIATTIMLAAKIMNHAFLYFIETVGMHYKLAFRYSFIQTPYSAINDFFHSPLFHL